MIKLLGSSLFFVLIMLGGLDCRARAENNWEKLSNQGGRALSVGDYKVAEDCFEKALMEAKSFGTNSEQIAASINNLASLYMQQGFFEAAESRLRLSLSIRRTVLSKNDPKLANSLFNIGICCYRQEKFDQAEEFLLSSLAIREQNEGKEGLSVADELCWLSRVFEKQLRFKEAESCLDRAIAIREKHLGARDKKTLSVKKQFLELLEREAD
ncbi:MAG: tetratricopeptide repeat protein [Candidatus Obscuribacterales bacterium]|nr:tetratricopeptide repeat protein [Candidatus Obscuribacterales bacterium]